MQLPIIVRPSEESDLEVLCDLYYEFHEFHALRLPAYLRTLGQPTADERTALSQKIKEIMYGSDSAILVADQSGKVLGLAEIYIKHPDLTDRGINQTPYAHLQSLVISQAYRRQGIGSLLLKAAEQWSHLHGAVEMTLNIWEYPASPLGFYQKAGFRTFRRALIKKI